MILNFDKAYTSLTRRKTVIEDEIKNTSLARVLSTWDLTLMGIGATLGVGIYVLAGQVARDDAGPAVNISFLLAAVASAFAGICYAEFAARIPRAGSAYVYSYVTVGEFIAFVIGWNLILEYVIGAASVAKGMTTYVDSIAGDAIKEAMTDAMPMNVDFLGTFPDFLAFSLAMVISIALAFGVKESSWVNNTCTVINLCVVAFVVIAGAINADTKNWEINPDVLPKNATVEVGSGGFAPFGITGIIKGAATCFYGFVGFDCVATSGEEAKTPQKSIPRAIVGSLTVIFLSYFGVSTVLTLMWPYYLQDPNAPLAFAFEQVGWDWAKWVVTIGAIFGLLPSLLGSLYPLPRILYAMGIDGLLFAPLGWVNARFKSPILGTILSGFLTGLMALLFNLQQLVEMMSIGTLMAYSIVAACVLILRFRKSDDDIEQKVGGNGDSLFRQFLRQTVNADKYDSPTPVSGALVNYFVVLYAVFSLSAMACVVFLQDEISEGVGWAIFLLCIFLLVAVFCMSSIALQPKSKQKLFFMVPFVPVIPALSLMLNLYLMLMLDPLTWVRFGVWLVVGLLIYFFYGISHSKEGLRHLQVQPAVETVS